MKPILLSCFLFAVTLCFSQSERDIINQIDSINTSAQWHYRANDFVESFKLFNKAIRLSDSIHDSYGNAVANFTLGKIYAYMHEYEEAERCFNKMLKESVAIQDNFLIASSNLSLGEVFKSKKPFAETLPYFENALTFALREEVRDQDNKDRQQQILFNTRIGLSQLYLDNNDPDQALIYLLRAENGLGKMDKNPFYLGYLNYINGLYFQQKALYFNANKKFQESADYLEHSRNSDQFDQNLLLSKVYNEQAQVLAAMGNESEAYKLLLKHNNYKEKFLNDEKVKQENIVKSKFLIENYKNAARLANTERIQQAKITEQIKSVNLVITVSLILLFISLVTLSINYRSKQKLSNILKVKNEELLIAKEEAEKTSELKTKFISNVTHELRTPLYGVVGITSLLLKNSKLNARDSKYLKSLKYSGDYLLNLVNDILQIGKIEAQKIELKQVSVNLKFLVDNLVGSFEYRLEESNNKLRVSFDEQIPEFITCDNVRLSQILFNLLGNSIKFTQNGAIDLRISVLNKDTKKVKLRFEVEDNGPGIPKEKQDTIFENFSQLDDENSNINYQGTGLGLSITKNLIELFNSTIELESELGKGTTFSFDVAFEIDTETKIQKDLTLLQGKSISLSKRHKILIVEDNKINQMVTKNLLQKENYHCDIAQNGLEALNSVKANTYDLILMDINMPVMNGNEATIAIRKIYPDLPILALTAADIEEVKMKYKDIGYNDVITKPFDNYEFFQAITSNLNYKANSEDYKVNLFKVS